MSAMRILATPSGRRRTAETSATDLQSRQNWRMAWHSGASTERSRGSRTVAVTSASMASWYRGCVRPPVTVYGRTSLVEPSSSAPKLPNPLAFRTAPSSPPPPLTAPPCQALGEPANGDRSSPRAWPATVTSGCSLNVARHREEQLLDEPGRGLWQGQPG